MNTIRKYFRVEHIIVVIVFLIGIILVIAEIDEIKLAIQQADWRKLPGAVILTAISYLAMSLSFALVCRFFNINMKVRDLAELGFVSNTVNHVITTGGVAGFSLRFIVMGRHQVPIRDVIASSMMHFYIASVDMMVMLPVGLIYLLQNAQVARGIGLILQTLTATLILFVITGTFIIFNEKLRGSILRFAAQVTSNIARRDLKSTFRQFDKSMKRGIKIMRLKPTWVIIAIILTWIDWFGSVFTLGYCLAAFGERQPFGVVMTGFVIAIIMGLISMIPGGIGVQEGAMTFVFHLLGVPIGQAVLAPILYRAIFFFLPYLVSLIFYRPLMKTQSTTMQ